jgi:DNA-binding CsgD family transcriptional regulator
MARSARLLSASNRSGLIGGGQSDKIIACKLSLSESTVKQQPHIIIQKLGGRSQGGLILILSQRAKST